ncbi:VanZ family protein [Microbulbifer guangxiensis]|uniref:VanZ family protein n=1 Tax=Microbulbifer guangxiensis TaxID=2904249 RepID=UPI001F30C7C2|nr:VanZ family protein [Microbulbifer guangxiensis]
MLLAFAVSVGYALRGRPLPMLFPHFDLLLHFAAFFVLAFLSFVVLRRRTSVRVFLIIFLLVLFAALIEWAQALWLPRRTPSFHDFIAGAAGVLFACFLLLLWSLLSRAKNRNRNVTELTKRT